MLDNNADLFKAAFPGDYGEIETVIRHFDFETALARLDQAMKTITS